MLRFFFTKKKIINISQRDFFEKKNLRKINLFRNFLFKNGIYYPSNGLIFLATTTSFKDLDFFIIIAKKAFKKYINYFIIIFLYYLNLKLYLSSCKKFFYIHYIFHN